MKKNYPLFFLLIVIAIISIYNLKENTSELSDKSILTLRNQHAKYLANSPFKKTLRLSKVERKAIQLPPNKYYEREWELTMNPATGNPEPYKVLELQNKLKEKGISARAPGDGVVGNDWIDRGPNNVGGRTRVVLFDPNDTNNQRVYAGGVSGGLWVNQNITDANSTWTLVSGVPSNMNISCITVDPRDSNTWYIGTGEQYTFGAAVGNGVYKTTDGGTNWVNVPVQLAGGSSFVFSSTNTFLAGIYYINDIQAWDNGTSTEVFIGVGAHLYGDASNPSNWLGLQSAGLYRTTDDGSNWSRIESANMQFSFSSKTYYFIPNDFEISANNTLWMGTITTSGIGGSGGGRVFSSSDGATWSQITTLTTSNRVELAVSSTNANKLYALTQGDGTDPHIFSTTTAFSSTIELAKPSDADNGISSADFTRGQAFYDLVIEVDPTDDDIFYVGGIDLFRSDQGPSTNFSFEWDQISKWSNNANLNTLSCSLVHADQHAFTFRPGSNNEAVIGGDGGVYYASSLSTARNNDVFTAMNTDYNVTQFYYGGYGPSTSNELILAGAQDNGSQFVNGASAGANSSVEVFGGDGAYSTIDKDGDYMIVSYVYESHTYFDLPYTGNSYTINNDTSGDEGDFINPAGLDHNLNIMYTNGTTKINRYTLGASSATKDQLSNALLDGNPTAFKVSPYTTLSTTLLVGTDNGELLKLTNANQASANITWEDISGGSFVGSISSVEFGATENDIFVTFHNYGVSSVWYTSNGGTSWKNKEGDLPDMPVKSLLQNPLARNEVIVGTDLGVWTSKTFNEDSPTWVSSTNGMSDVKVVDLDLRTVDNSILATTFGRGTFTGQFTSATDPTFTISTDNSIVNVCKPDDAVFNFDFTALGGYSTTTTFSSVGAPSGSTITFSPTSLSTTGTFTMTIGNTSGVTAGEYTITVTGTGAKNISTDVVLIVNEATLGVVSTTAPSNGASDIAINDYTYTWNTLTGATSYDIDIATDAAFSTIIETGSTANNSYTSTVILSRDTVYYWRVRANNFCLSGNYSTTQNFQTVPSDNCSTSSNSTTVAIPDGAGAEVAGSPATSVINVTENFTVSDINVTMNISHTWINDLVITLISPNATEIILFDRECSSEDDITVTYDDQVTVSITCASPVTGTAKPTNALAGFNGENTLGNWTLKVVDYYNGDTGSINSWSIEVCEAQSTTNSSLTNAPITVGTNSTYVLKQAETEATSTGSTASEQVFMLSELPTEGDVKLSNTTLLLGETFTQNDINTGVLTYVNNSSISASDFFKVDITNATGGFLPNQQISITIDAALGVDDDFFLKTGISIFPTVSDGNFFISSKTFIGKTTIELYSYTGQKVYSNQLYFNSGNVERISIQNASSGVYILKLISETTSGSKKIIIK